MCDGESVRCGRREEKGGLGPTERRLGKLKNALLESELIAQTQLTGTVLESSLGEDKSALFASKMLRIEGQPVPPVPALAGAEWGTQQ